MNDLQEQLHKVRQALHTIAIDGAEALQAVKDAEQRLADADVAFLLGGSPNGIGAAQEALTDARLAADVFTRRRSALVSAEDKLLLEIQQAQQANKREQIQHASTNLRPQLDALGEAFLKAGIEYAATFALVNEMPGHLVDPTRLLSKLSVEKPLREAIGQRMHELIG